MGLCSAGPLMRRIISPATIHVQIYRPFMEMPLFARRSSERQA